MDALQERSFACAGTLFMRRKTCGRPDCHCGKDPGARHGPYFVWTHKEGPRLVHRVITPQLAETVRRAISDYRAIRRLIARWDRESAKEILQLDDANQ